MKKIKASGFAAAFAVFLVSTAHSEPGLRLIQEAFGAARFEFPKPVARPALAPLVQPKHWMGFPPPDAQTLAWLVSRIPGLDAGKVHAVPLEAAEGVMQRAFTAKATYLDIFTDEAFRNGSAYYVSQAVLDALDRRYISGTVPVRGQTEDGKTFQMQGLVAGQGKVQLLFDRGEFTFKEDKNRFKVHNNGRVEAGIRGAGDISIDGLSAYGAPVFCPWAKIQRMSKESMYKIRVETSCGARGGNDISPILLR
ncbi:MAG: hypothetical protein AAB320_05875 [Elusimicrobiota bacterium]